jgi:hypothetical protein
MIGLAIGGVFLIFVGIAFALNYYFSTLDDVGVSVVDDVAMAEEGDSYRDEEGTLHITEDVKLGIGDLHDIYNDMLGWGRDSRFDDPDHWVYGPLEMHQQMFSDLAEKSSGDLRQDFMNAVKLLDIAMQEQDVRALLYTHRIVHDLDIEINGYGGSMFGYTQTIHGSDRVDEFITDYE